MSEKNAAKWGIPYVKSYTHSASHASYYPGAFPLSIKLLFQPGAGRILGAQAVGKDGVDKRIDVLAAAVRHGMTVDDLSELELAYAPPFGSAKDPVNMAGFVAQNILAKRMPVFYAEDVAAFDPARQVLLDVRTAEEHELGCIPQSALIPLDSLRGRLAELDAGKEILVYCQVGLRGYLATRILLAGGFRAKNLSGGYKTWSAARTADYDPAYVKQTAEVSCSAPARDDSGRPTVKVDACGLQCPGPIAALKAAVDKAKDGDTVEISANDRASPPICRRGAPGRAIRSFRWATVTAPLLPRSRKARRPTSARSPRRRPTGRPW